MGLNFTLYENKSHNDVEIKKVHEIEEVLYLAYGQASILVNWFYRVRGNPLNDNYNEGDYYIRCYGWELWDIIVKLELILNEEDKYEKDKLALWYFPVSSPVKDGNNLEMWSALYYSALFDIYNSLKKIYSSNSVGNRERLFYYNISW
jgi:hypothetical protein